MKKLIFVLLLMGSLFSAGAQKLKENQIPSFVKESFLKIHPQVKKIHWEKEGDNYEAGFEMNEAEHSILFDPAGTVLEDEVEIAVSELPLAAQNYISSNYKGSKIEETTRITDSRGKITYEAEINGQDILFDTQGGFIKQVTTKN